MHQVIQQGKDVSAEPNPNTDRWIEFRADGTFHSDDRPYGPNSGRYTLEALGILFLDSDAGEHDDSRWMYVIEEDITWQGGSDWAEAFVIIHHCTP